MADENIRIIAQEELNTLTQPTYVLTDNSSDGTHKYDLNKLALKTELTEAIAAETSARETSEAALEADVTNLKEDLNNSLDELGFAVVRFIKTAGSSHSSTIEADKLSVNIKSGQKFYITVSQTGSETEFGFQLFGWLNGTSSRITGFSQMTSNEREEITATADYDQLSIYIGNDRYAGSAEITFLYETEESNLLKIDTMESDISNMKPFFELSDFDFISGYGVRYTDGVLVADSTYNYCTVDVTLYDGTTIRGYSGTTGLNGIAFYDANGVYISGFGNPVSGTYNWNIEGLIPENAVTAKIHCRTTHLESFWIAFDLSNAKNVISDGIAETRHFAEEMTLVEKKTDNIKIPVLRNGSAGNSHNANSISTQYIIPIDFSNDILVVEYLGDTSLADVYAFSYCAFRGAIDGMTSSAAFTDTSITKLNYNQNATIRSPKTRFELSLTNVANYDHIMFYLWRYKNDVVVPLRIATDQYNFRITYKKKDGIQSQRDIDFADTKHDLLHAKHVKANAGTALTILHFSDLHADTSALARIMKDAEEFEYDDAICTGDIVGNSATQITSWWDESVLTCIGNHDSASYNATDGYNWTALSMADRDAYYIAPFESDWDIVHAAGTSYYYKDYTNAKVRLIVMDAMLYSSYESDATLGTNQTAWLNSLLSDAISNNLHVLIATHAPHGGATAEDCSFSRFRQDTRPPYNDCNTPQVVIDAVANAITNGLHFIGYLVGHTHQDNIWDAENDGKQLMYCVTCAHVSNNAQWRSSDQHRDTENDAYNIVVVDTANTLVKLIRGGGANVDDHMRTRKAICFDYTTGEKVGEVL